MNWRSFTCAALLLMNAGSVLTHEPAAGACGEVSRDVVHELAVMHSPAIPMSAEANVASLPHLALDRHYALNLITQDQLRLAARPGRAAKVASPRGGVFRFEVPVTGRYRVSITSRHWIDVVDGEKVIESADHFGPGCDVLHKVVEFNLAAGRAFTLQLSGEDDAIIGLAITAAPPDPKQERT